MAAHACRWVLSKLRANLAKELDFRLEADNAQRLAAAFAGRRGVAVPLPVPEVRFTGAREQLSAASVTLLCKAALGLVIIPDGAGCMLSHRHDGQRDWQVCKVHDTCTQAIMPTILAKKGAVQAFYSEMEPSRVHTKLSRGLSCRSHRVQRCSPLIFTLCMQLSGERVLTMEWIDGCKLTDMDAIVAMHVHPRDVAIELLHAFAQMTFVDGFGERSVIPVSGL